MKFDGGGLEREQGEHSDDSGATTLYAVDCPTQEGIAIALPTKNPETNNHAFKSTVALVKRMAYQTARLRSDNESAAELWQKK